MNIFILDLDPKKAAEFHCDKHMKMIVESAQMLSTAHLIYKQNNDSLYKITHINHPCSVWTRKNKSNYLWLYELFKELSLQYELRYHKKHRSYILLGEILSLPPNDMSDEKISDFPLCMPDQYKDTDPVKAYRNFYIGEKLKFSRWTFPSKLPYWIPTIITKELQC